MKVSEITMVYLDDYLNLEGQDHKKVEGFLNSAKNYCIKVTSLTIKEIEESENLVDFILIYISQMYDQGYLDFNESVKEMVTMDRRF